MISVPRQLLIQAIFIAINAIFAALEMAMVSLSTTRLKMLEEEGDKAAIRLLKMLENPAGFLSAIQFIQLLQCCGQHPAGLNKALIQNVIRIFGAYSCFQRLSVVT